jgi:chemotaxis protein MotB
MSAQAAEQKHEILIIRRGGHDDHDDHHGGAWKIAFADFMTAMMCFFLVMWLINAANEQTKAAVASYFNPIKLTDRNASRKGLDDSGEGPVDVEEPSSQLTEAKQAGPSKSGEQRKSTEKAADAQHHTDEHLFSNPYAVLAEIAEETGAMQNMSAKGDGGAQDSGPATGASGGESFRDPFAPDFWSKEIAPPEIEPATPAAEEVTKSPEEAGPAAKPLPKQQSTPQEVAKAPDEAAKPEPVQAKEPAPDTEVQIAEAKQVAEEIRTAVNKVLPPGSKLQDGLSVEATKDGIVISITDQLSFGMFEVGSAVPRRDMVLAMEQIGKVLSTRNGRIHVNGHTDGRPYAGDSYDNWRLSTARAHSAYYMLVRSGLDEKRLAEISGFADRKLKVPDDPFADANRRIEVLLEYAG